MADGTCGRDDDDSSSGRRRHPGGGPAGAGPGPRLGRCRCRGLDHLRRRVARCPPASPRELTSVGGEDDGLDDDLTVIWEIEPGATILETATLPRPRLDHFDDPSRLDAFLDAVRWGAITSADSRTLQAPFRSGITIEDYQLDPVVRALQMPASTCSSPTTSAWARQSRRGLVVQELLLRHRARTVLVVCPASLTLKWKAEMGNRFGLEFRVVDTAMLRELRRTRGLAANPFKSYPRLIVSIDWLKRPRAMRLFRDVLPPDAARLPPPVRPADRRRGPHLPRPPAGVATPVTPSAPTPSARSPPTSSTASSSRPHRTTATPSRSPRSSSCSTRNGSPAA